MLQALDRGGKQIDYYALDLSLPELNRTLNAIRPGQFKHVRCWGFHGTYDDGLQWLKHPSNRARPKVVLSMGSSVGNFERHDAVAFLESFANALQPQDVMLIGVDGCLEGQKVYKAYNDDAGVTHSFYRNGLEHANRLLGHELFKEADWDIIGEFDQELECHQAFVSPKTTFGFGDIAFKSGERIRIERSYKYSSARQAWLWQSSGLALRASYGDSRGQYCKLPPFS